MLEDMGMHEILDKYTGRRHSICAHVTRVYILKSKGVAIGYKTSNTVISRGMKSLD